MAGRQVLAMVVIALMCIVSRPAVAQTCFGDVNCDNTVNVSDLLAVISGWGMCTQPAGCDSDIAPLGGDNLINVSDLLSVISGWGPCPGPVLSRGPALIFPRTGPIDLDSGLHHNQVPLNQVQYITPSQRCLTLLGTYGDFNGGNGGQYLADNAGLVKGRFLTTDIQLVTNLPAFAPLFNAGNDFRVPYNGDANFSKRKAHIWNSQVAAYYAITDFRTNFANDAFFQGLGLPANILQNITQLQERPDLVGRDSNSGMTKVVVNELYEPQGISLDPFMNQMTIDVNRQPDGTADVPLSIAYGIDAVVGDYAGLMGGWALGTNGGFPSEWMFGQNTQWISNALPAVSDGHSDWTSYVYTGKEEILKGFYWIGRATYNADCGTTPSSMGNWTIPCDRGFKVNNAMQFDETAVTLSAWNRVFPFHSPGFAGYIGPPGADLAAFFYAAIFYDISKRVGIGDLEANRLAWKTLSLIDNSTVMPMRRIGQIIQKAARELWPSNGNTAVSVYEDQVRDILLGRGIPVDARLLCSQSANAPGCCTVATPTFPADYTFDPANPPCVALGHATNSNSEYYLPKPIGGPDDFLNGDGTPWGVPYPAQGRLGSAIPDSHPSDNSYGTTWHRARGYTAPNSVGSAYVAYQLCRHTQYGPCDWLAFTDGTFSGSDATAWTYNNDGTYYHEFRNRELENTVMVLPAGRVSFNRVRGRCPNEIEGPNSEDVAPFGFRVIKEIQDGFSFIVQRTGETATHITYQLTVVDPSQTVNDTYAWEIDRYSRNGMAVNKETLTPAPGGPQVSLTFERNQPVRIKISRTRNAQTQFLEFLDRINDLDRANGSQFLVDLRPGSPLARQGGGADDDGERRRDGRDVVGYLPPEERRPKYMDEDGLTWWERLQRGASVLAEGSGPDSPVTMVLFSDYQCPFCRDADRIIEQLAGEYPGLVRVVVRQHPLEMVHPHARTAALAALAAGEQGRFADMHAALLQQQDVLNDRAIRAIAESIGLNMAQYDRDVTGEDLAYRVWWDTELATTSGLHLTPSVVINGEVIRGAKPIDEFRDAILMALAKHARGEAIAEHTPGIAPAPVVADSAVQPPDPMD